MNELAAKLNRIIDLSRSLLPVDVGGVPFTIERVEHAELPDASSIRLTVVAKFTHKELGE